jgi:subtilisin family serine protease
MTKFLLRILVLMAASVWCLAALSHGCEYILQLNAGANLPQILTKYGLTLVRPLADESQPAYLVSAPASLSSDQLLTIEKDPAVYEIEADQHLRNDEPPNTPPPTVNLSQLSRAIQDTKQVSYFGAAVRDSYVNQPAARLIDLPQALSRFATGGGIVAVIDTGVDPNHPALQGALLPGYDFTRDVPGASEWADLNQSTVAILDQSTVAILDQAIPFILNQSTVAILDQSTVAILDGQSLPSDFGHGTMVSGLVHLVAPTSKILPLKAFNAGGSAKLSDIVRAIYYAVDNGAQIINMSFSSLVDSRALNTAMTYAWNKNVICFASTGNDGMRELVYPASDHWVIGVGSTSLLDERSFFSNYGNASMKLAAPGEALITTYPGNHYAGVWGTSFSSALVSGAGGLLLQIAPQIGPSEALNALKHGKKLDGDDMGAVRLDAYLSLAAAK